jgi:hypothetical protein
MLDSNKVKAMRQKGRTLSDVQEEDFNREHLGPLQLLPGTWKNDPGRERGWNMIALPFTLDGNRPTFRLLLNQYHEELDFTFVDDAVPNRGIPTDTNDPDDGDQFLVALDYEQTISQVAAVDFPESGKAGEAGLAIHHEPGLWVHMANKARPDIDVARLATIPHGDSVLALGNSEVLDGELSIPNANGLPIGVSQDLDSPYLTPYKHFNDNPFTGNVNAAGFPGFNPVNPSTLLQLANQGVGIVRTTKLEVDTTVEKAGISNIPFITKEANASEMKSTFWIQELAEKDEHGNPKFRLQYLQVVLLDFFPRRDGAPGLIRWPHISINTLDKMVGRNMPRRRHGGHHRS